MVINLVGWIMRAFVWRHIDDTFGQHWSCLDAFSLILSYDRTEICHSRETKGANDYGPNKVLMILRL